MNKLVIVGNGFDLAHGLPTSYKDFIDDFWKNLRLRYEDDQIKELVYVEPNNYGILECAEIKCYLTFKNSLRKYTQEYSESHLDENKMILTRSKNGIVGGRKITLFKFQSNFFFSIHQRMDNVNWVDIENEYYRILKECAKKEDLAELKKLNKEFEEVKRLFENYLNENIFRKYDFNQPLSAQEFLHYFEYKLGWIGGKSIAEYQKEFKVQKDTNEINYLQFEFSKQLKKEYSQFTLSNCFLTFNYTPSLTAYIRLLNSNSSFKEIYGDSQLIHIHGELGNTQNPINFGFGDENDKDYAMIEDLDENEYLKYFKSFQYSQNDNYDKMLRFIESDKFQVYIMGHSCGLSDRTLLSTIFEHEHCRSIKIFYHQRKDGSDNYTELVQNISRHFKDKKMMRAKIVNKELCEPLPQNMRFQKIENPAG